MSGKYDALFDPESLRAIQEFYDTRERWQEILAYRKLADRIGHVRNLFYGDSITEAWPLHEHFPNHSLLNRGIGGDNVCGLYLRLAEDVFAYTPEKVFILIGINGIELPKQLILDRTRAVAELIRRKEPRRLYRLSLAAEGRNRAARGRIRAAGRHPRHARRLPGHGGRRASLPRLIGRPGGFPAIIRHFSIPAVDFPAAGWYCLAIGPETNDSRRDYETRKHSVRPDRP